MGFKVNCFNYGNLKFLFEEIFYKNIYYFKSKSSEPVIIDAGANIGVSVLFFKWIYPRSKIYAFEPDPHTFSLLRKNIEQNNLKDITLINSAVSDVSGMVPFYIDPCGPGSLSMSLEEKRLLPGSKKILVRSERLSQKIKEKVINFLKLDVEGAEHGVIKDLYSSGFITKVEKMAIEYHHNIPGEKKSLGLFIKILEKSGFRLQVDSQLIPLWLDNRYQDINICCYRRLSKI